MSKTLIMLLGILFIFNQSACCGAIPPPKPTEQDNLRHLIQHINDSTVAILTQTEDGWRPSCTGVWINETSILTAAHCIEPDEDLMTDQTIIIGSRAHYAVQKEVRGLGENPSSVHLAVVVAYDHSHDLAMLRVVVEDYSPKHDNAILATSVPVMGDKVHMVGHIHGLYYSYTTGVVSAYRVNIPQVDKAGPFIQCSMPLWHGNSGGGGFNDAGELIGIADFMAPAPHIGFLIAESSVRQFLFDHRKD